MCESGDSICRSLLPAGLQQCSWIAKPALTLACQLSSTGLPRPYTARLAAEGPSGLTVTDCAGFHSTSPLGPFWPLRLPLSLTLLFLMCFMLPFHAVLSTRGPVQFEDPPSHDPVMHQAHNRGRG